MSVWDNKKGNFNKRPHQSSSSSDTESEKEEIDERITKRKGRRKNLLLWAEPDEDKDVPRSTLKRLSADSIPSHQVPNDTQCLVDNSLNKTFMPVTPARNADKSCEATLFQPAEDKLKEDNPEFQLYSEQNFETSPASTEIVSTVSSEHDSSENNDSHDLSEDECQGHQPQEQNFIPEDAPEHEDSDLEGGMPVILGTVVGHEPEDSQSSPQEMTSRDIHQESSVPAVPMSTPSVPIYKSTLDKFFRSEFVDMVTAKTCISPRELLLNLLNLDKAHTINRTLFVNICKLINSMFSEPIIPDTTFKVDSLLLSTCGVKYHFYCEKCLTLLRSSEKLEFVTCKCGTVNNVLDLTKASYFVSFDICTQLEIILRNPEAAAKLIDVQSYERVSLGMHDLYDGEVHTRFRKSLDFSDGALHLFKPIVRRLRDLSTNGAIINICGEQKLVKIHCIEGCFDSAARGPAQGIHLRNGMYGCSWCLHPGETEGQGSSARKYKYLENPPALRTHQQVKEDAKAAERIPRSTSAPTPHVNGVLYSSPLLKLPDFDIVNGMVVDAMHNSFLGVTRQFLRLWCGLEGNVKLPDETLPAYYIGSPTLQARITARIQCLVVPIEMRRLPRPLTELTHFKAHELEIFLLYFLFIVLEGILKKRFLTHMTLYVQGMYLLMKDVVLPEDCRIFNGSICKTS